MDFQIERATPDSHQAICDILLSVWGQSDPERVRRVLSYSGHATHLAVVGLQAVGFVDGFPTRAADGTLRWEVDLLGVLPAFRGRGIARRLVSASVRDARQRSTALARALIRKDNVASQRAFYHANFRRHGAGYRLFATSGRLKELVVPADLHLIGVETMTYSGVWVEGGVTVDNLRAARALEVDVVGAVLPLPQGELALKAGYEFMDDYDWWVCTNP